MKHFWLKNRFFSIKNRIYAREGEENSAHNEFWYIFLNPIYENSQIKKTAYIRATYIQKYSVVFEYLF